MTRRIDTRLNEITDRYRELNDQQERINREQIAAQARQAFPAARAFARAQLARDATALAEKFDKMRQAVAAVEKDQRIAGDYQGAARLDSLTGKTPQNARGKETAGEIRDLAMRTDNNPPSLAQAIPPPMQDQTQALEQRTVTAPESANQLAWPRLAMTLEATRLFTQADPRTAVAYDLLGEDLGSLLESPARLNPTTLRPLTERVAALAGQKGEQARQAEIAAANERFKELAANTPNDPQALAAKLDGLSALAKQAADQDPKRQPLASGLDEMTKLAPPAPDWADSINPRRLPPARRKNPSTASRPPPSSGSPIATPRRPSLMPRANSAWTRPSETWPYSTPIPPLNSSPPRTCRTRHRPIRRTIAPSRWPGRRAKALPTRLPKAWSRGNGPGSTSICARPSAPAASSISPPSSKPPFAPTSRNSHREMKRTELH